MPASSRTGLDGPEPRMVQASNSCVVKELRRVARADAGVPDPGWPECRRMAAAHVDRRRHDLGVTPRLPSPHPHDHHLAAPPRRSSLRPHHRHPIAGGRTARHDRDQPVAGVGGRAAGAAGRRQRHRRRGDRRGGARRGRAVDERDRRRPVRDRLRRARRARSTGSTPADARRRPQRHRSSRDAA